MAFPPYPTTERQKKLLGIAGELASIFAKRASENDWAGRFPYENYRDLQQAGYLTLTVPRDLGGWGADFLDVALAQQRLAQGDPATALVMTMHLSNIAKLAVQVDGSNPLFERICRAVVEHGATINTAASEPATGSPSRGARPSTTAHRQDDGSWIITGRKTYTTGSPVLHFFLVSCGIEDKTSLTSLGSDRGTFLVPRTTQGVRVEETWNSMAMRESGSNDLILDNVHVGSDAYVDEQIPSRPEAQAQASAWNSLTPSVYLGIAEAARNEAVSFARKRKPTSLGQPIATLPHIQEKVAAIELALLQSRAVYLGLADQFSKDPASVTASQFAAAKYLVTNHAVEVVDLAMRVVGAAALSLSNPLQRYYRDVRAGLNNPPMDDAALTMIAKEALQG